MKKACAILLVLAACGKGRIWYDDLNSGYTYSDSSLVQDAGGWSVVLKRSNGYVEIPLGKEPKEGTFTIKELGEPIRIAHATDKVEQPDGARYYVGTVTIDEWSDDGVSGSFEATREPPPIKGTFKASR